MKKKIIALIALAVTLLVCTTVNLNSESSRAIAEIRNTYIGKDLWTSLIDLEEKGYSVNCYDTTGYAGKTNGKFIHRDSFGKKPFDMMYLKESSTIESIGNINLNAKTISVYFSRDTSVKKTTPTPTPTPEVVAYAGRNVMEVKKELENEGYTLGYYNKQRGVMLEVDPSEIGSSEFPEYMLEEHYKVARVEKHDAEQTADIYFYYDNVKKIDRGEKKSTAKTGTFNADDVWWKLEQRGDNAYPYGFRIHYLGSSEVRDGDGWIFTSKVTVTNAYGTKRETFLYATVSSTGSITSFEVY